MAATRRKAAGKVTVPPARLTRMTPSSSGWRSASSAATGNSPSSSRNRTPLVARLTSPGRRDQLPPPTRDTMEAWWCGARNGGRSTNSPIPNRTAGRRVDPGHRERLGSGQRRQQPDQAFSQHRLARTGWSDHQEVVTPRRRDFHGASPERLTPHVGQVGRVRGVAGLRHGRDARPVGVATQNGHQLAQRGRAVDLVSTHQRRLTDVTEGHDHAERARRVGQGDHAGDMAQRAIQPELSTEGTAFAGSRAQLARGDEQAHGEGEVEPGTAFPHSRRGQVDDCPSKRPRQPAGQEGGANAIPRLAHRCVGQSDDGESGQAVGDVHLDRYGAAYRSGQRR